MYGYPPPWGPMTFLPPGYQQQQDPVKAFKAWKKVLKEEKKDISKEKPKVKLFTFMEVFMLCTIFSLPVGMITSLMAVNGLRLWVNAMSAALGTK